METKVVETFLASYNDDRRKRKLSNDYFDKEVDQKVNHLAIDKMPSKHFGRLFDHLVANGNAKSILRLFSNLLGTPRKFQLYDYNVLSSTYQQQTLHNPKTPIGIVGHNWINALLQFIIKIPSLRSMFDFIPKCLNDFSFFIDCYEKDQSNRRAIVSINSEILIRCLNKKFNERYLIKNQGKIDLYKILALIMGVVHDSSTYGFLEEQDIDLLAFHPSWHVLYDIKKTKVSLENQILNNIKHLKRLPKDLLVAYRWFSNGKKFSISKKAFARKKILFYEDNFLKTCYELDAFIEYRGDGFDGRYITYVKIDDIWYQCEDSKIRAINSDNLKIALIRSILFHYKRIQCSRKNFI